MKPKHNRAIHNSKWQKPRKKYPDEGKKNKKREWYTMIQEKSREPKRELKFPQ